MSDGYLGGSTLDDVSILLHAMEAGFAAPAFVVMKMRPPLVPAHTTFGFDADTSSIETWPPERSSPHGYGGGQGTVQTWFGSGLLGFGHRAAGPLVSRPAWPGSPIGFQSSQTSTDGTYVPFSSMSPSPFQVLQCCLTFAYGKAGLTPPFSERKTCSRPVNRSLPTSGWNTVGAEKATASRG